MPVCGGMFADGKAIAQGNKVRISSNDTCVDNVFLPFISLARQTKQPIKQVLANHEHTPLHASSRAHPPPLLQVIPLGMFVVENLLPSDMKQV